jgi:hypothetical protein
VAGAAGETSVQKNHAIFRPERDPTIIERMRRETLSLKDVGHKLPVSPYWPHRLRNLNYYAQENWQFGSESVAEQLYDSIIVNPLDAAPRQILADYLQDNGVDDTTTSQLRGCVGGLPAPVPIIREFRRWPGPGLLGRTGYGTWDVWVGASNQFVQACREGMFLDCPITTVATVDRWPPTWASTTNPIGLEGGQYLWGDDQEAYNSYLINKGYPMSPVEWPQSLINEATACFLPKTLVEPVRDVIGVYKANNLHCALLALSQAYVNLGRYAIGLPAVEISTDAFFLEPERSENYLESLERSWWEFGSAYWEKLPRANDYGRHAIRKLATRQPLS